MNKPIFESEEQFRKILHDCGYGLMVSDDNIHLAKKHGYIQKTVFECLKDHWKETTELYCKGNFPNDLKAIAQAVSSAADMYITELEKEIERLKGK